MAKNNKKKNNKNNKNVKNFKSKKIAQKKEFSSETISVIFICLSFLLFFSVYGNSEFILLSIINTTFKYLFGYGAYLVPISLFIIGIYIFIKKQNLDYRKYISISFIVLIICAILEISDTKTQFSFIENIVNASSKNGGLIGYLFGAPSKKFIGNVLSYILLTIALLFTLTVTFDITIIDVFTKIKEGFLFATEKIINSLSFDSKDNDEYFEEKEIFIKDEKPKKPAKLNIEDEILVSSSEELQDIKDIDFSVNYGFDRKRDKKVQEKNNTEGSNKKPSQRPAPKHAQKPNIQLNIKNLNPFSKKPKLRVMDFSEFDREKRQQPLKNLESLSREHKPRNDESYFVNLRKNHNQNQEEYREPDVTYITHEDINSEQDYYYNQVESEPTIVIKVSEVEKYEKNIKTLKDEIDRQIFLFQDTQKEFLEQKKMEQSLLKIINAQRETIDKLTNELEVYKNISKNMGANQSPTQAQVIKEDVDENNNNTLLNDEDALNISLNNIKADAYKIASELTEQDLDNNVEEIAEIIETSEYLDDENDDDFDNSLTFENETDENDEELESTYVAEDDNDTVLEEPEDVEVTTQTSTYVPLKSVDDALKEYNVPKQTVPPLSMPTYQNKQTNYKEPDIDDFDAPYVEPIKEVPLYEYPTVDFLNVKPHIPKEQNSKTELITNSKKLEATLKSFGVVAKVLEVSKGPSVTRYEIQPGLGVKVSKIANLADDLALNLAAKSIRIQAPIPGKAAVGIEVPNETTEPVFLREVLDDDNFKTFKSKLAFGIGKDITGKIVVADLATMPHLLIAGATGSGKSVCVNTLITSIVYKSSPEEVKLMMIDPKVVELSVYNGIPHLLLPVITDPKKAASALNWAVREMEKRYKLFSNKTVRDLKGYNALMEKENGQLEPQIVVIIDELADLMMTAAKEVEAAIIRLAQMARAAGIHLIIATQRPSVDVITGIIKANIPSRLAFSVSSGIDSKTILDETGAEKLLGKGDMLFKPMGAPEPMRIQGAFISDKEVESIVEFLKTDADQEQMMEIIEEITSESSPKSTATTSDHVDEIFEDVVDFIIAQQKASTSLIQRKFRVGFNRAARIVDELEDFGVIGPDEGNKPRKVLMSKMEWDNKFKV